MFVQNQLRTVTQVPAGPFTLDNVPVISGAGDARVVVRDALGRESIVTSSFYVAGGLLRPGLTDWNVGAGKLRDDLGGDRQLLPRLCHRPGPPRLHQWLTPEGRVEVENERTKVVGGAVDLGGLWGEFEVSGGLASVDGVGSRYLGGLGYRYVTLDYNLGLRWVEAQQGFRLPGDTDADPSPTRVVTLNGGARIGDRWSAGVAWLGIDRQAGRHAHAEPVRHLCPVTSRLGAVRVQPRQRIQCFTQLGSVVLSMSLGPQTSASAGADFGSSAAAVRRRAARAAIRRGLGLPRPGYSLHRTNAS